MTIKMNGLTYMAALLGGILLSGACSKEPVSGTPGRIPQPLTVRLEADPITGSRAVAEGSDDCAIETATGYRFVGELLCETLPGDKASDGAFTFRPSDRTGEIRFVANDTEGIFARLEPGVSTLGEFLQTEAPAEALADGGIVMDGRLGLTDQTSDTEVVRLRRSVARIDIATQEQGVEVHSVSIRGIARRGYVIARQQPATPANAERTDFVKEYTGAPLSNGRETLLYVCEQAGSTLEAEVLASFGGGMHRMVATLPEEILRNRIYTLDVHGAGAGLQVTVQSDGWEEGASADATPSLKGVIDVEASTLPAGIRVNDARDSVYVAYAGGSFRLAVRAEAGAEIDIEGTVRGVTAEVEPARRSLEPVATVSVTGTRRIPGEARGYLYLTVRRGGVHTGRVVIRFEPNPVQLDGALAFDENGICDFGKYVDGELGRIILPRDKSIRLEFDSGEDPWMKLVDGQGAWRVLGGWKPNDPKADGRPQEARIVIASTDGSDSEQYVVRRRNQGLPVVEIGGTWWCKYNLRGNVKSFDDQISIQADPAADTGLAGYLTTCPDDELLRLLGDQYQGGNPDGLPLRHNGTAFYHEGMRPSAQNFGTLDPTAMAPDGYRIPDYDDYAFFGANENYNLGGVGSRSYRNAAGEEITVRIIEREAVLLGQNYGTVSFYEFRSGSGCWVLCGLGHQWDTTPGNIARMMLLLATSGDSARSWYMEGYAQADRPNQNWLKYTSQNSTKTRIVRCVKSPVEYIYE